MMRRADLQKPVFIIGLHRTGSTLIKNILHQNSKLAMATDEMHIFVPFLNSFGDNYKKFGNLGNNENLANLVDFIFNGKIRGAFWKDYRELGISKEKIYKRIRNTDHSLKNIIIALLDEYRIKERKKRVGVKYPLHFCNVNVLYNWYGDCKIIFLTRDIRATCASKLNDEATRKRKSKIKPLGFLVHYFTLFVFIIDYIWSVRIYLRYKEHNNFYKLRYEDLITNPEYYIREICNFCEIDFEEKMLSAMGKPSSYSDKISKRFDITRIYNWKKQLGKFDRNLINILTSKSMDILGYGNIEKEYLTWKRKK